MRELIAITTCLLVSGASIGHAAEDDRGPRGFYFAAGGGFVTGSAVDGQGRGAGAFTGGGGHLRLGEEVIPRLSIGLELTGGGAAGTAGTYDLSLGGFVLQVGWRPLTTHPAWLLLAGVGVGGGSLSPTGPQGAEGSAGGALYQAALTYELELSGGPLVGWRVAPAVRWLLAPSAGDAQASVNTFVLGVDATWYAGR